MNLGNALRKMAPWWARLGAKVVLSRLGVSYRVWKRLGVFAHGQMDEPRVCFESFRLHLDTAGLLGKSGGAVDGRCPGRGFVMLELGPGDSLYTALAACAHGATRCYLVDDGNYATGEVRGYLEMARDLRQRGFEVPSLQAAKFVNQVLTECNAQYLTDGIASLRGLPSGSVDFIFSNAVLEHVRRDQLPALLAETRRVLKANGRCCHRVDLQDHLGGALNNLRFSDTVWESDGMARSGFYTNRVRYRELLGLFENAGFSVEVKRELRWSALPTRREKLAERFRALPEDDLLVYGFDAVLRPR